LNSPATSPNMHEQLLTTASSFHNFQYFLEGKYLLQVLPDALAIDTLNPSNCLLVDATDACDRFMDEDANSDVIYALRFMVEASRALVSAATASVEFGNLRGGQQ